jgi:hypothetical protein
LCMNKFLPVGKNTFYWNRQTAAGLLNSVFPSDFMRFKLISDSLALVKQQTSADSGSISSPSELVKSGLYKIRIEAKTTYLYNRYFTKKIEVEFAI